MTCTAQRILELFHGVKSSAEVTQTSPQSESCFACDRDVGARCDPLGDLPDAGLLEASSSAVEALPSQHSASIMCGAKQQFNGFSVGASAEPEAARRYPRRKRDSKYKHQRHHNREQKQHGLQEELSTSGREKARQEVDWQQYHDSLDQQLISSDNIESKLSCHQYLPPTRPKVTHHRNTKPLISRHQPTISRHLSPKLTEASMASSTPPQSTYMTPKVSVKVMDSGNGGHLCKHGTAKTTSQGSISSVCDKVHQNPHTPFKVLPHKHRTHPYQRTRSQSRDSQNCPIDKSQTSSIIIPTNANRAVNIISVTNPSEIPCTDANNLPILRIRIRRKRHSDDSDEERCISILQYKRAKLDDDEALEESLPEPEETTQGDDLSPVTCGLAHVLPTSGYQRQADWDVEDGSGSPPSTDFITYPTFDTSITAHHAATSSNSTRGSHWQFGASAQRDKDERQARDSNLWSWSENFMVDGQDMNIRHDGYEPVTSPTSNSLRTQSWGCGDSGLGASSPDVSSPESVGHHNHLDLDRHPFATQSIPQDHESQHHERHRHRHEQQKQLSLSPRSSSSTTYTLTKDETQSSLSRPYQDNERGNDESGLNAPTSGKTQDQAEMLFTEQVPDEGRLMLDAVNGFFLVLDGEGRILYVSENIQEHLGHSQADMLGRDVRDYIYAHDINELQRHLSGDGMLRGGTSKELPSWMTRRTFYLGMKFSFPKSGTRSKDTGYSLVQWNAKLRYKVKTTCTDTTQDMGTEEESTKQKKQKKEPAAKRRRTNTNKKKTNVQSAETKTTAESTSIVAKVEDEGRGLESGGTSRYVKAMVVLCRPVRTESVLEIRLDGNMFISRHDLGFHFIFCDPRVSMLIGYEPSDMLGRTAFQFHSPWDAIICKHCAKQLILAGTATSGYYRFLSRTGVWVWMATSATIVYDTRRRPQYIVCRNYLISPQIAQRDVSRQKKDFDMMKYSAFSLDTDLPMNYGQSPEAMLKVGFINGADNGLGARNGRSVVANIGSSININTVPNKSDAWGRHSSFQGTKSLAALRPRLGDIDPNTMLGNLFPTHQTNGTNVHNPQSHPKQSTGQISSTAGMNEFSNAHGVDNSRVSDNRPNVSVTNIAYSGEASKRLAIKPHPPESMSDSMEIEVHGRSGHGFDLDQTDGFSTSQRGNPLQFEDHEPKLSNHVSSGRPSSPILTSLWNQGDRIPGFLSQSSGDRNLSNTLSPTVRISSPVGHDIPDGMSNNMADQVEFMDDSVIMDTTTAATRIEPMRDDSILSHGDLFPTLVGPDFFSMLTDSLSADFNFHSLLETPQSIPISSATSFSGGRSALYGEIRDSDDNKLNEFAKPNTTPNVYERERMDTPICFDSQSPPRCQDQTVMETFQTSPGSAPSTPLLTENNQHGAPKQQRLRSLLSGAVTGSVLESGKQLTPSCTDVSTQSKIPEKSTFISNKSEKISILKNTLIGNGEPPKIPQSIPALTKPIKFVASENTYFRNRSSGVYDRSHAGVRYGSTVSNSQSFGKRAYPYKIIPTTESCDETSLRPNQQFTLVGRKFPMSKGRISQDSSNTTGSQSDRNYYESCDPGSASSIELMNVDSGSSSSSDESSSARQSLLRTLLDKEGAVIQGPLTYTEYMLRKALKKKGGSNSMSVRQSESVLRDSSAGGGIGRTMVKRTRYKKMNQRKTVELPLPKLTHGNMIRYGKGALQNRKPTKELPLPCLNSSQAEQNSQRERNENTHDVTGANNNSINDISLPDDLLDFAVEYCGSLGTDQTEALLSDISESSLLDDSFDSFVDSPAQIKLNECNQTDFELNEGSRKASSSKFSIDPPLSQASLSHNPNTGIFQSSCLPEIDRYHSNSTESYISTLGVSKFPSVSSTQSGSYSMCKGDNTSLKLPNIDNVSSYGALNGTSLLRTAMTIPDVDRLIEQIPLANRSRTSQNQTTSIRSEGRLHSEMSEPDVFITKVIGMKEVTGAETARRSNHGRLFKVPVVSPGAHSTERVLNSSPFPAPSPESSDFSSEYSTYVTRGSHSASQNFPLSPSPPSMHRTCQSGSSYRKPSPASLRGYVSYAISPRSLPSPGHQDCGNNMFVSTGTQHSRQSNGSLQLPTNTTTHTNTRRKSSSATSVTSDGVIVGQTYNSDAHSTSEPVSVMVMRKEPHRSRRSKSIAVQTDNMPGEVYPEFDRGPADIILYPSSYLRSSRQVGLQQSSPRDIAPSPSSSSTASTPSHSPQNMSQLERFLRECPSCEDSPDVMATSVTGVSHVEGGSPSSRSGANTPFLQRLLTGELSKDNYRRLDEQMREHERRLSMSSGSDES